MVEYVIKHLLCLSIFLSALHSFYEIVSHRLSRRELSPLRKKTYNALWFFLIFILTNLYVYAAPTLYLHKGKSRFSDVSIAIENGVSEDDANKKSFDVKIKNKKLKDDK